MRIKWTTEMESYLIELREKEVPWSQVYKEMNRRFGDHFSQESCRSKYRSMDLDSASKTNENSAESDPIDSYGVKIKRNADGTIDIDRIIKVYSENDLKDDEFVLKANGYDPAKWEIVRHDFSMWNHLNKKMDHPATLYANKLRVKPKKVCLDTNKLLEIVTQTPKITYRPKIKKSRNEYLLLPLFDMHFGISDYEYYMPTQAKILDKIKNRYKEVLLIFGQDAFHNDDFRGRTSSGKQIEQVDMVKAWKDATLFFEPIIKESLERNSKVSIVYSKGNHSETMEWSFVQYLKARYPQCNVDDSLKERKVHMLGKNFIGMNHGDKKNEKRLPENFATEFPIEWSKATTRTVFTGHRHHEMVVDIGGVLVRRMPTRNEVDQWHDDMGYTTAHKRFQIHEYNDVEQIASYYV